MKKLASVLALIAGCSFPEPDRALLDAGGSADASFPQQQLTVVAENRGIGSGLVTMNPPGMTCSNNTCTRNYDEGSQVELVATPGANSRFVGWTGDCEGIGACSVTMDGAKQVGAVFAAYQLIVNVTGDGAIALSDPQTSCTSQCTQVYTIAAATVTLTPQPGVGQAFGGWSAGCSGVEPCTVVMDQNRTISGSFGLARTLTVTQVGGGQGMITSADDGITCGSMCTHDYLDGTMVVLTAAAETGHVFGGFSPPAACESATAETCTVRMDAAKSVSATFSVVGIDLVVSSMSCTPSTFSSSASVSCSIAIKNIGDTAAVATTVDLWQSQNNTRESTSADRRMLGCSVPALAPGATSTVTCAGSWSSTAEIYGPAYILAVIDPNNSITEASETNNIGAAAVTATTTNREFVLTAISCTPTAAAPGRDVSCSVTIYNAGDQSGVTGSQVLKSRMNLWATQPTWPGASGTQIGTCMDVTSATPIAPQSSVTITCAGTIPANYATAVQPYVGVLINPSPGAISEKTTDNNYAAVPFYVAVPGGPDLRIETLTCPTSANPGAQVSCSLAVRNVGEDPAMPFDIDLRFSADSTIDNTDSLVATCSVPASLKPGQASTLSCSGMIPTAAVTSAMRLGVIADSANVVTEVNETNNTASQPITIGPDVIVQSISCPGAATSNSTISCTVVLKNQGSVATPAFANQLRWSTDSAIDTTDTLLGTCNALAIAPGGTQSITCSGTVPSSLAVGVYYAGVIADSSNAVAEAAEMNNTASAGVGIGPNLTYSGFSCTPYPVTHGTTITCSGTLQNTGAASSGVGFTNQLRMSSDFTIDATDTLLATCNSTVLAGTSSVAFSCAGVVPSTATAGGYYFGVLIDAGKVVTEFNEADNNPYDYDIVQ